MAGMTMPWGVGEPNAGSQCSSTANARISSSPIQKPGIEPLKNDRTPDIIVQPIPGTIYTGSKAKVAEHGGFSTDDTHVALLVVNGRSEREDDGSRARVVSSPVFTRQIAPTILQFLGLNPEALDSVRIEETATLPR
jgi:hypothetical protein